MEYKCNMINIVNIVRILLFLGDRGIRLRFKVSLCYIVYIFYYFLKFDVIKGIWIVFRVLF